MNYVSGSSVNLTYVVPVASIAQVTAANYHCEVHNVSTGVKRNFAAGNVIAPTAPTVAVPAGVAGSVAFTGLATPTDGTYILDVYYADAAGLDAASMTKVGSTYVHRVTPVSAVTA